MEGRRARKPAPRVKEQRPFRVPCAQHNGRKCLLRAPQRTGSDEWVSGTISNCKGGDDPVADVILDDSAEGKPHRIHLLRQMVRIANDVVWGGAHIDSVDLISTGDGAVEPFVDGLEPVLIFAPFGQPDDDNTSDQLLAQSLVDNQHFWISMEATRNFVLHTWKRKIEPPLKKAVLQALEYKKQFDAWHMNEKFRKKIVGRRIAVWCDSAMTWCCGEIQSYEKSSLQHSIIYDGKNTQSFLDVSNEVVHLLSDSEEENRFDVYSEQGKCCHCSRFGLRAKLTSRGTKIVFSRRQEIARRERVARAPSQTRPTKSTQSTSPAAFEATSILRTTAAERAERAKRKAEQETGLTTAADAYSSELDWGCKKLKAESGAVEVMPLKAVLTTAREDEPEEAENPCEFGADAPRVEEAGEEEGAHAEEEDAGEHGSCFEGEVHSEVGQDADQHFSSDDTKPAYTGDALHCSNCWDTFHFECMDKRLDLVPEHWTEWRCVACKECHVCKSKGRLAICDTCDRGFHIACLDPPLKGFPFRAFKCPDCVQCSSCGTTNAKLWAKDYTMCQTCERAFSMKKFCPICLSAHRNDDGALVKCTRCQFSIHPACDGMDSGMVEMKSKPDSEYACPNCRGERTSTLLLQVLDKLQREDREGFFAEPVPVEYAVAMQYHTVVDSPMDFKTMREKILANAYGSDSLNDSLNDAVAAFRKDFELICTNAMAFHRPNEKCHIKAKRLLPFGVGCILSTFPWSKPADHTEDEHPTANLNSVTSALQPQQQDTLSAQPPPPANGVLLGTVDSTGEKTALLLESEWDFNATVSFTTAAGAAELEFCFVCGACDLDDSSSRSSMLHCWHCAEAFHVFCTPPPCPEINEDTILHWIWFEGRYCGVCGVCYDDDDPFANVMVKCDTCGLWIHAACDGMDEQTYAAIGAERPGYGIYECPDCADESHFNTESIWRTLSRLVAKVQHRRLQFSPELLSLDAEEPGISSHPQRKAACLRWVNERAHAGVDWALESDASTIFAGRTPLEAWLSLQSRRSKLSSKRSYASTFSPERQQLEAAAFFGFGLPAVAQLIEQLPDPVIRRPSTYKAALEMYYRPFINRGELPCPELHMKPPSEESAEGKSDSVHLRKREVERSVGVVERGSNATATALKQPMPVEVRRSPIHNWGLFTTRPVPKDGIVVEYKGRELRNTVADRKEKWYEAGAIKGQGGDCYMFRLDEECVLDATTCGNAARFMNHCCTPNCYCKVVEGDKNKKHIVIFAQRDLEEGEEVTYDYKFPVEKAKIPCHCGAPKCLKIMN
ncbi:hypothetical protein AB1Y20_016840 [Prymnesium parvum]|uniref:Histone-lysine N-methyltransferase n=1 Tax=Prymnesium parvum TaxID=97485 RepID=A0AB34IC35_PRYPA